jgi:hypothetical protein
MPLTPGALFPVPITTSDAAQTTAYEAIADLERIECSEDAQYLAKGESLYVQALRGEISLREFVASVAEDSNDSAAALQSTAKVRRHGSYDGQPSLFGGE